MDAAGSRSGHQDSSVSESWPGTPRRRSCRSPCCQFEPRRHPINLPINPLRAVHAPTLSEGLCYVSEYLFIFAWISAITTYGYACGWHERGALIVEVDEISIQSERTSTQRRPGVGAGPSDEGWPPCSPTAGLGASRRLWKVATKRILALGGIILTKVGRPIANRPQLAKLPHNRALRLACRYARLPATLPGNRAGAHFYTAHPTPGARLTGHESAIG
jgi:hypothetical protein